MLRTILISFIAFAGLALGCETKKEAVPAKVAPVTEKACPCDKCVCCPGCPGAKVKDCCAKSKKECTCEAGKCTCCDKCVGKNK